MAPTKASGAANRKRKAEEMKSNLASAVFMTRWTTVSSTSTLEPSPSQVTLPASSNIDEMKFDLVTDSRDRDDPTADPEPEVENQPLQKTHTATVKLQAQAALDKVSVYTGPMCLTIYFQLKVVGLKIHSTKLTS